MYPAFSEFLDDSRQLDHHVVSVHVDQQSPRHPFLRRSGRVDERPRHIGFEQVYDFIHEYVGWAASPALVLVEGPPGLLGPDLRTNS